MFTVSVGDWWRDVGAVFSGRRGAVTERAAAAGCSRQTVYDHARAVAERWSQRDSELARVRAELAAVRADRDRLQAEAAERLTVSTDGVRRFAIASQALGVSLRQAEELLGTLLPADRVPDHATLGRWAEDAGKRAGEVLRQLDPVGTPGVSTLCVDEIFFGG
jgi:hypothetical protein